MRRVAQDQGCEGWRQRWSAGVEERGGAALENGNRRTRVQKLFSMAKLPSPAAILHTPAVAVQEDLARAAAVEPGDGAIARELQAARAERRRERAAEARLFKGFVDRAREGLYEEEGAGELSGEEAEARDAEVRAPLEGQQGWLARLLGWLTGSLQAALATLFPSLFGRRLEQQQQRRQQDVLAKRE